MQSRWRFIVAGLFLLIAFFHLWQLAELPRGLYVDESSIGLNAALIAGSGHDEHGQVAPVYFEAFGEYKNPLYTYLAAGLFKLVGVSEFALRLTSVVWFMLFLVGFYLLIVKLFAGNKLVIAFGLIAAGFLPWFFPMSRIAFEVISQPMVIVFALFLIYKTYHEQKNGRAWLLPLSAGFVIGLSVYTYSTARLLSALMLSSVFGVYFARRYVTLNLKVLAGFCVALVPYLTFSLAHPGALTDRFKLITYVFDPSLSVVERIGMFVGNYLAYFSPNFTLYQGDTNLRHHIGYGGELFVTVAVLACIGLGWLIVRRRIKLSTYPAFLLANLLLAPVAAALTVGHSALRSVLVGLYLLLFSLFGLCVLVGIKQVKRRVISCCVVLALLLTEVTGYLHYYFTAYPTQTVAVFESYDFKRMLETALRQKPDDIVVSERANMPYAHLEFYRRTIKSDATPLLVAAPVAKDGRCVIFFASDKMIADENLYTVKDLNRDGYTRLRCYSLSK